MAKIFAAVLITCVVIVVVFQFVDPKVDSPGGGATTTLVSIDGKSERVTISGQVTRPGTYSIELDSTLGDLIQVAGGATANADELAYNTSYLLEDGATYYIAQKYDNNDVCSMEPIAKVNINKDNEEDLQITKKITSSIAKAIVTYRDENGNFECLEDLKKVKGIGNATFEKLKDYVRIRD